MYLPWALLSIAGTAHVSVSLILYCWLVWNWQWDHIGVQCPHWQSRVPTCSNWEISTQDLCGLNYKRFRDLGGTWLPKGSLRPHVLWNWFLLHSDGIPPILVEVWYTDRANRGPFYLHRQQDCILRPVRIVTGTLTVTEFDGYEPAKHAAKFQGLDTSEHNTMCNVKGHIPPIYQGNDGQNLPLWVPLTTLTYWLGGCKYPVDWAYIFATVTNSLLGVHWTSCQICNWATLEDNHSQWPELDSVGKQEFIWPTAEPNLVSYEDFSPEVTQNQARMGYLIQSVVGWLSSEAAELPSGVPTFIEQTRNVSQMDWILMALCK